MKSSATCVSFAPKVVSPWAETDEGYGHYNEQPPHYGIERLEQRGFSYLTDVSAHFQSLPDEYAPNVMVFVRQ
jgi:hypothetical protein